MYNVTRELWGRGIAYRPIEGFDTAMLYFCLREPARPWNNAQGDRDIGGLWATLSGGRCKFVMVSNKQWEGIEALL